MGRSSPRTGKGINILIGLVFYMFYSNGLLIAKTSIENNDLNPFIGLWSIHILLIIFLIIFSQFREGKVIRFIAKMSTFINKEKGHV